MSVLIYIKNYILIHYNKTCKYFNPKTNKKENNNKQYNEKENNNLVVKEKDDMVFIEKNDLSKPILARKSHLINFK